MPKDRRVNSPSFDRAKLSPYSCSLKDTGCKDDGSSSGNEREWEEARCPICMEHPHNAVLLLCSSQEKGCRPFMCDTSYRHSNCLDQFRKSFASSTTTGQKSDLVCPLCRGCITGWVVKAPARRFMNSKTRCCSLETCNISGNYTELRRHARLEHPSDRPSETSAIRQSNWTTLERQLEINDALVHQLDFEYAWDGWPSWDELGDADFWSDGTFFDFPMEEMSDFDDDVFGSLPLSDASVFSSLDIEGSDSDFSREYDSLHRRSTDNSSPSSDDRSPSSSSRPTSVYHRENNPTVSESSPTSHSQEGNPLLMSRSTSSYPIENNPTISGSSPRSNNGGGNSFSISRSTARYDRENDPTNSRSISSYERENYATYSRSSYREENVTVNSRTRSSRRTGEGTPLARRAESRDFPAFSRQWSP